MAYAARSSARRSMPVVAIAIAAVALTTAVRADEALPPWVDANDVPLPRWARSVVPNKPEAAIYAEPGRLGARRGSAQLGARLPLYGARRANGCMGRWLSVGPFAWMCSDVADVSPEGPVAPVLGSRPWTTATAEESMGDDLVRPARAGAKVAFPPLGPTSSSDDGLPYRYYFAGRDGAYGFTNLASALDDAPDQDLEPGFAVAVLEERSVHGERWGRTKMNRWVAMRELVPVRQNLFHGERISVESVAAAEMDLDVAWIVAEKANVYGTYEIGKPIGTRLRFQTVHVLEERAIKDGRMLRVSGGTGAERAPDGTDVSGWMRGRDLARARRSSPPPEVRSDIAERWIDVDLASQTLVAYEGLRPVFATVVSTGKGPVGSEFVTRTGTFRIWAKLFTTKMDNLDKDAVERHYAIEDVPWVQFFDKAIALHGVFWHRDFGRVHSHGCVNLAPLDARWLFAFTSPHLPAGWTAALPTRIERGAIVRVR